MKKQSFNYSRTVVLDATTQIVTAEISKNGALTMVQVLSGTDETTSPTRLDIGYLRGAHFVPYQSSLAPAIGQTVPFTGEMFLVVDEKPAIRIVGGVVGDHVQIAVGGYQLFNQDMED